MELIIELRRLLMSLVGSSIMFLNIPKELISGLLNRLYLAGHFIITRHFVIQVILVDLFLNKQDHKDMLDPKG